MPLPSSKQPPPRIQIQNVRPQVDCGRYPAKSTVGDRVEVTADIFKDGHEVLRAVVRYRPVGTRKWLERPLEPLGNDHWAGEFEVGECGRWQFTVEAWVDRYASYLDELDRKLEAGQLDLSGELSEGEVLFGGGELAEWRESAPALGAKDRHGKASLGSALEVDVERERARFGSWYELFPRSWGGFRGVAAVLPALAELGFDVVYLPPVHPIGTTNRKGRNNTLVAEEGDPGSPWAIGSPEGGHEAIHPELGTWKDFDAMIAAGRKAGVEIALDLAIQCSPDHPWLVEHPEWFNRRPDGTLKYAENPPKKYQDIYNVNFDSEDWRGLWEELRTIVLGWCEHGVRIFRVDNPHTKSVGFWEWLIREVRRRLPGRDLPLRGVYATGDDDDPRQGRLRPVVHVLHLEEHEGGARRVHRAARRMVSVLPAERLRQHAGHPPRVPPARRPAGLRHAARAGGDALADLRDLLRASRASRTCRSARAARSTSTRRSTS